MRTLHKIKFQNLGPKKRYWKDVDEEVLSLYLRGVSYRKIKMIVGRKMASRMGISTGWQRIQRKWKSPPNFGYLYPPSKTRKAGKALFPAFLNRGLW